MTVHNVFKKNIDFSNNLIFVEQNYNLQIPICCILVQLLEIYHDTVREIPTALKTHYAVWCHKYDNCILFKAKFLTKEAK